MTNETIEVFYKRMPVGNHETIVYTDTNGNRFIATAEAEKYKGGISNIPYNLYAVAQSISAALHNSESAYGKIVTYIGPAPTDDVENMLGTSSVVVASSIDLSNQWAAIVHREQEIENEKFSYSVLTQNSNSVASTALVAAGLTPPDNSLMSGHIAVGDDNLLDNRWTPHWERDFGSW
jgi:hypothetical protein